MIERMGPSRPRRRRAITLGQYIRRRNGLAPGASGSLRNMLSRSLGAGSFAGFWRYWNPVFGYYLGRHVYQPLARLLPRSVALVSTFVACGALHDLVTTLVRGSAAFLFTPWFFLLGTGVVVGERIGLSFSDRPRAVRVAINISYLAVCLGLTIVGLWVFRSLAPASDGR